MRNVQLEKLRLTGANLALADIEDATFQDCRIDLASFRFAKLKRVHFENCQMQEVDFYEAKLTSVVFTDCVLVRATLAGVVLQLSTNPRLLLPFWATNLRVAGLWSIWVQIDRKARPLKLGGAPHMC